MVQGEGICSETKDLIRLSEKTQAFSPKSTFPNGGRQLLPRGFQKPSPGGEGGSPQG